jgi:hypothetical protein
MRITSVTFHDLSGASEPLWKLRLEVKGSDFLHRAASVVAVVGNVLVEAIVVNLAGDRFSGLLGALPADGSAVKVGYLDTEIVDTGLIYQQSATVV